MPIPSDPIPPATGSPAPVMLPTHPIAIREPVEPRRRWWSWPARRRAAARRAATLAAFHARTTAQARRAQIEIVRAGYHLGPIPHGYTGRPHVHHAADGRSYRVTRLVVDPFVSRTIEAIYRWYTEDYLPISAIARQLGVNPAACMPRLDPATGLPRPWTRQAILRILTNPVYTGTVVWGRTRGGQLVDPDTWIVTLFAHEPIIDGRTFFRAQLRAPRSARMILPQLPAWQFQTDQDLADPDADTLPGIDPLGPTGDQDAA
jgi:hypothetical protein